jgi:DNA-binding transcriptional MerR regulator
MSRRDDLVAIGTFASAARLTVKALRHYQHEGLLAPCWIDPATGYRFYSWDQFEVAVRIATLRDLDAPVDAIRSHLQGDLSLSQLAADQRARRVAEITAASRALGTLEELLGGEPGPYEIDTVEHDETVTWALDRQIGTDKLEREVSDLVGDLLDVTSRLGLDTNTAVWGEYPVTLDKTVTVTAHLPAQGRSVPAPTAGHVGRHGSIPAGVYARAVHHGSTATLPFAYRSLLAHLGRRSQRPTGPVYERYLTEGPALPLDPVIEVLHRLRSGRR